MTLLSMTRGDTAIFDVALTDGDGLPLDLVAIDAIRFTAKRRPSDADSAALVTKTLDAGIAIVDEAGGTLTVRLEPEDTAGLADRYLYWDLQVEDTIAGDVRTPLSGHLALAADITGTAGVPSGS